MNHFKFFFFFVLLAFLFLPTTIQAQGFHYDVKFHYDVNNDNDVNVIDAVLVVNKILGQETNQTEDGDYHYDVNLDNHENITDVILIINYILHQQATGKAVDLGLPSGLKWASCNVGANSPEEIGDYYAWGELEVKDEYNLSTYIHCNGTFDSCINLGDNISGTKYDVAHVKWGGKWRMPTVDEIKELINECTLRWVTYRGVKCARFVGPNGRSIYMPAGGYRYGSNLAGNGENGVYWTGTAHQYVYMGNTMEFTQNDSYMTNYYRSLGFTIRPVMSD